MASDRKELPEDEPRNIVPEVFDTPFIATTNELFELKRKKVCVIGGARPQFIKLAPVLRALKAFNDLDITFIHTGQHYDENLSGIFFNELQIPAPDINLSVGSGTPDYQFSQIISKLSEEFRKIKPDLAVVVGDTNSTAAAAISAAILQIPLAHIESGLREYSFDIPEEVNKLITDSVASLYFCPTQTAVTNLQAEQKKGKIVYSGDPGLDLISQHSGKIHKAETILEKLKLSPGEYYFATCHRALNTNDQANLCAILDAFIRLDRRVIFPVHPRTSKAIRDFKLEHYLTETNILTIEPIGFWETQALIKNSSKVITDSGGLIKEAYYHDIYVIIIDTQTEWVEVVNEGRGIVTGPDSQKILIAAKNTLPPESNQKSIGAGNAAEIIASEIYRFIQ